MKKNIIFLFCFVSCSYIFVQNTTDKILQLKKEVLEQKSDTLKVSKILKIANIHLENKSDSVLFYYNLALKEATNIASKPQVAEILSKTADYYYDINEHKKAINNYIAAAAIFKNLNNIPKVALIYNWVGYCYQTLLSEDKAIEYYLKSLTLYRDVSNDTGVAFNSIDIGNLFFDEANYNFAKKYYEDALAIYEKQNDSSGIATSYSNLGNVYAEMGSPEIGLDYYKRSINLQEALGEKKGVAANYNNMGDNSMELNLYKNAQNYFLKSLKIAQELNDRELTTIVYLNLAELNNKQQKYREAIKFANKSIHISKQLNDISTEAENLKFISRAYEGLGNMSKAHYYLNKYAKIKDSLELIEKNNKVQLFNAISELEKNAHRISHLETENQITQLKYETERKFTYYLVIAMVVFSLLIIILNLQHTAKKKACRLLEFKNHQINRMNEEIESQRDNLRLLNNTKDRFFSIIAHDLKNPFNSIKGFTELMIENSSNYSEEKRLKFLKIIKGSTTKASTLLNNLLIWANSQSGNFDFSPKNIEVVQQVSNAVSFTEIQAINKEIEIINKVENNIFVNADENMFDTILRNLISNAIKFTEATGTIEILAKEKKKYVEIIVKDTGVGMSNEVLENLFNIDKKSSSIGTANEQGSGLGLILCKDFVEKHGGKISVISKVGKGSEFSFTLPKGIN